MISGNRLSGASDGLHRGLPLLAHQLAGPEGGEWVTFVPGIGNDRSFWQAQAEAIADRYRTLIFDPWGHGDSPEPPAGCTFGDTLAGVLALWDHLGIARSHMVGLGFGGSSALALALEAPQRVASVTALCCRPRQPDDRRDFWRDRHARAAEIGMARMADITVDRWLSEDFRLAHPAIDAGLRDAMRRTSLAGYQTYVAAFIEMDFTDRLGAIACPVQLVTAEHDHGGGPLPAMEAMAAAIPGARLSIIAGSGHICVAEAPDRVASILSEFLAGLSCPAGT